MELLGTISTGERDIRANERLTLNLRSPPVPNPPYLNGGCTAGKNSAGAAKNVLV